MTLSLVLFWLLASSIVVFGLLTIFERRILRAAVYLLVVLVAVAGLYYMMNFAFLAAVQLMLYAGGIVVLIIFSILLTSQINAKLEPPKASHLFIALVAAGVGIGLTLFVILPTQFTPTDLPSVGTDMKTIGYHLMDIHQHGYVLPFEVISVLLLAVLVGTSSLHANQTHEPSR